MGLHGLFQVLEGSIFAREAAAQKGDTQDLEALANSFGFFTGAEERQRLVEGYNPRQDYTKLFSDIADKTINLDLFAYTAGHTLGTLSFNVDNIATLTIHNAFEMEPGVTRGKDTYRLTFFGGRGKELFSIRDQDGTWDAVFSLFPFPRNNQTLYLLYAIAEQSYRLSFKPISDEWSKRAWLSLRSNAYAEGFNDDGPWERDDLAYNPKTKEFIFFGSNGCEPCEKISKFLLMAKIPFKELEDFSGRAVPRIVYKNGEVKGRGPIIDAVQEMYGLKQKSVDRYKQRLGIPLTSQ